MIERNFRLLAIPFGGPIPAKNAPRGVDLDGEFFTDRTDIGIGPHSEVPVFWHHRADPTGRVVGQLGWATNWVPSDRGWLADVTLTDSDDVRLVQRLSDRVELYGSTGVTSGGAVRRGQHGEILAWPVAELSLSPSPQNLFSVHIPPFRR